MKKETIFNFIKQRVGKLSQKQVDNIDFLLDFLNENKIIASQQAYILATIEHETGGAFQAIKEKRASREKNHGVWAMQERYWYTGYYGRGAIQLTHKTNYLKAVDVLKKYGISVNSDNPEFMLDWKNSVIVAVDGMINGWFTGVRLSKYISGNQNYDFYNARKVVNGLFHAERVETLADEYLRLLTGE